jgi:uncharacterized protein YjeT (DUF2065 family)
MTEYLFIGVALVLVFEGILPFLSPRLWRRAMQHMLMQDDRALHVMGLVSMLAGVILLYLVH